MRRYAPAEARPRNIKKAAPSVEEILTARAALSGADDGLHGNYTGCRLANIGVCPIVTLTARYQAGQHQPAYLNNYALALAQSGQPEQARQMINKALDRFPDDTNLQDTRQELNQQ